MDTPARALLAVGLVLATVPIWAPALDVTGPDYVYERANVTVDDGLLQLPFDVPGPSDQIACFELASTGTDRSCLFEQASLEGNVSVPREAVTGDPPSYTEWPRIVVLGNPGRPYERTVTLDGATDEYVLGLEPVPPGRALEVAADTTVQHDAVRRALETGSGRAEERHFEAPSRLYATDDGYAVVHVRGVAGFLVAKPSLERALEAVAVLLGAVIVFRTGRRIGEDGSPKRRSE